MKMVIVTSVTVGTTVTLVMNAHPVTALPVHWLFFPITSITPIFLKHPGLTGPAVA